MDTKELEKQGAEKLAQIFATISDKDQLLSLFDELFTDNELKALSKRWLLMEKLNNGETQREIAKDLGISLCKITRGSKLLKDEKSAVKKLLNP